MPPLKQVQNTAAAHGKALIPIGLPEYLDRAESIGSVLLEESNGQLHAAIGCVTLDGTEYLQIIRQQFEPHLVPKAAVSQLPIKTVWTASAAHPPAIEIAIGRGVLTLDRLWHNFGLTQPFSEVKTTFRLRNTGSYDFRIEHVSTQCGCTTVDFPPGRTLAPGESEELTVAVKTGDKTSFKHAITLRLAEPGQAEVREVPLALFGNQFRVMSIVPERIDFGSITPGGTPVTRVVKLKATDHDRFRVQDVESTLPVTPVLLPVGEQSEEGIPQDGYALELTLNASESPPGLHHGTITVRSTSRYRPVIELPVEFKVRPHVELVPSVAAFGAVALDSNKEERVALVASGHQPFTATVLSAPKDCQARIERTDDQLMLVITPRFSQLGAFLAQITIQVSAASWTENLELQCVATVLEQR